MNYKRELLIHENNRGVDDYSYISQNSGIVDTPTTTPITGKSCIINRILLRKGFIDIFLKQKRILKNTVVS